MQNLQSSIHCYIDPLHTIEVGHRIFEPVKIAILDSGYDSENPLLLTDNNKLNPQIKDVRSFVHGKDPFDMQDEIGHGTHALGLLLKVATCAEIYIVKIANQETLDRNSYADIATARLTLYQR